MTDGKSQSQNRFGGVWLQPFLVFFLAMIAFIARSPEPLANPLLYAEDGSWTGIGLTEGWLHALLHARPDYLVALNVLLLWLAVQLGWLFSGDPLTALPVYIAIVSFAFLAGTVALLFITLKRACGPWAGIAGAIWLTLMPLGYTQNEIFGRILQLGFYVPLLTVALLFWRDEIEKRSARLGIDALIVLCAATNPVVFLIVGAYGIVDWWREKRLWSSVRRLASLAVPMIILAAYIAPRLEGHGGIVGASDNSNWIEAAVARTVLYPILFTVYEYLNDLTSILLLIPLIMGVATAAIIAKRPARNLIVLTTIGLLIYILATLGNRPGLTGNLSAYSFAMPVDRYFMGINALAILLFTATGAELFVRRKLRPLLYGGSAVLIASYATHANILFEAEPRIELGYGYSFEQLMCFGQAVPGDPDRSVVPINPFGWNMEVPSRLLHQGRDCRWTSPAEVGLLPNAPNRTLTPSRPLTEGALPLHFWSGHENREVPAHRLGILFGTYGGSPSGAASLVLNQGPENGEQVIFDVDELEDNRYAFFDLPPGIVKGVILQTEQPSPVSTWESTTPEGATMTCIIVDYVDDIRFYTPGCPPY